MYNPQEADLDLIRQNVPETFESWAPGHADGTILTLRPYDPEDPYQRVENVRIEPEISLEYARILGKAGIGELAHDKLCAGFINYDVVKTVFERHKKQQNTIITTLHLRNVLDTAATHNGLFVASDGDPQLAEINDIIVNPMLAYLSIGGIAVFKALTFSGGIDLALPYRGAKKHGMQKPARQYLARRMREGLDKRISQGVAMHWALTGTRATPITTEDGKEALAVDRVEQSMVEFAAEHSFLAVPVPIDLHPADSHIEVLEPRILATVNDVHEMTEEMIEATSRLSGTRIYYGMPKGAQPVEV